MITWVIENIEADNHFLAWLKKNKQQVLETAPIDYYKTTYDNLPENAVFIGSLNTAQKLKQKGVPHIWLNDNFRFSKYVPAFGTSVNTPFDFMLNKDFSPYTVGQVLDRWESLFEEEQKLFIRPDSYAKVFPGLVIDKNHKPNFEDALDFYQLTDMSTQAYVSPFKHILAEYRLVCTAEGIITSSQYMRKGDVYLMESSLRYQKLEFVNLVLPNLAKTLDVPIFIVDVGETVNSEVGIIEVNSFNTSGLYKCDPGKIVETLENIIC